MVEIQIKSKIKPFWGHGVLYYGEILHVLSAVN